MIEKKETLIGSIRDFIKTCPYLKEFDDAVTINVDKLSSDTTTYTINEAVFQPILKKYVDGSSERQYVFVFGSREEYGHDVFENIENIGFFEDFSNWLEVQVIQNKVPILGVGKQALTIEATTNGYAFQTSESKAIYQIQCKLTYFQKKLMKEGNN